ncbi:RNA-binding cell elongation regulator Jag/EloR [Streptococcus sp. DD12]|uniref:RNA-binding cell elongation regulator Jag/EloR n=1 Tax=Streptococcus sp. DD12 TaxID=1777880 RepID=UPI00079A91E5|nr:RNA-binding cell elongation regulator Jag/EloR [Streptococcus sp. DD12]KXT75556.1 RNA-binding protein Jag [Streptococcus sp. DD12]
MVVFTGKTVEDATHQAVASLGVSVDNLSIRVITMGKKGFLGIGRKLAEIDVTLLSVRPAEPETPTPATAQAEEKMPVAQTQPVSETDTSRDQAFEEFVSATFGQDISALSDKDIDAARDGVTQYLETILQGMGLDVQLSTQVREKTILLQMDTQEPGRLIGYHGKILKALQVLVQNYLHDRYSKELTVTLNVADYMERRYEVLESLARKAAARVQETGRDYILDPMPNNERKQLHKVLSTISGVDSYSAGADGRRRVVVTLER